MSASKYRMYSTLTKDLAGVAKIDRECSWWPLIDDCNPEDVFKNIMYSRARVVPEFQNSWQNAQKQYNVWHMTYDFRTVGFLIGTPANEKDEFRVLKVGVTKPFRRRRVAECLLQTAARFAETLSRKTLVCWVRETQMDKARFPEWCVVDWLKHSGWYAQELKEDMYRFCGYSEAGMCFKRPVTFTMEPK